MLKRKKKILKLILEKKNEEVHIIKNNEKWCLNCRKITDHGIKTCPNKKIVCQNCNHRGHYKYDCYIYKNACYRCLSYGKIIFHDECIEHKNVKVCGCIIMNNEKNKLLLVKGTTSECWGFPKGALENNETLIECAYRETLEETGIEVDINSESEQEIINGITYYYTYIDDKKKLDISEKIDKNEISDIKWVEIENLLDNYNMYFNKSVKIYIQNIS